MIKTVNCPSCGATAQNFQNCEFCGSLFVRSISVGYDPNKSKDLFYFESIAKALKQNLEYQSDTEKLAKGFAVTTTDIYLSKDDYFDEVEPLAQVPDSKCVESNFIIPVVGPSIALDLGPALFSDNEFKQVKKLDEIKFFSSYRLGDEIGYIMNFGNDYIGAAKILSKILIDIKKIGINTNLFCFTKPGFDDSVDGFFDQWVSNIEDNAIREKIQKRVTDFRKSKVQKKGCFVATAVMGDYNHPVVLDLRFFRDNWLLKRKWGVGFTNSYYKYGPKVANFIDKSTFLKKLTYFIIVKPLQIITKIFFK